jgi:hypothetical protein
MVELISIAWPTVPDRTTLLLHDNSIELKRGGRLGIIVTSKVFRRQLVPIFTKIITVALERSWPQNSLSEKSVGQ